MREVSHLLPKRVVPLVVLALAVAGLLILFFFVQRTPERSPEPLTPVVENAPEAQQAIDTDGDGLFDWEEQLWGTNKRNPDTDGDGSPDGEEIIIGRDPTIPAPNDERVREPQRKPENPIEVPFDETRLNTRNSTDSLAVAIFSRFLDLQEAGIDPSTLSAAELKGLVTETIGSVAPTTGRHFGVSDIAVSGNTDTLALTAYGNAVGTIFTRTDIASVDTGVTLQSRDDIRNLAVLDGVSESYRSLSDELRAVTTPSPVASAHLSLVNALSRVADDISAIRALEDDPIGAIAAFTAYDNDTADVAAALALIATRLRQGGASFAPDEPGFALLQQ